MARLDCNTLSPIMHQYDSYWRSVGGILKREDTPGSGEPWRHARSVNLPSGCPEQFEGLSACAEREFHEETGLIGVSGGLMAVFETLVGPEDRVLYYVFCCQELRTGTLLDCAEWVTPLDAERLFAGGLVRSEAVIEICRRKGYRRQFRFVQTLPSLRQRSQCLPRSDWRGFCGPPASSATESVDGAQDHWSRRWS